MNLPALLLSLFFPGICCCLQLQLEESQRFVVLNNGQVVEGKVTQDTDRIVVTKPSGSRIVFQRSRIDEVCSTRSEVYWNKCALLRLSDIEDHVRLFRWCLEQRLFTEAQNQIDLLMMTAIDLTRLSDLNRQLLAAIEKREAEIANEQYQQQFAFTELPARFEADTQVRVVSFETTTSLPADVTHRSGPTAAVPLSDQSIEIFRNRLEPILITSCYTAKCHDDRAIAMPLSTIAASQDAASELSRKNLKQILAYTDIEQPLESRWFTAATHPHAGRPAPLIAPDSPHLRTLQEWLLNLGELASHEKQAAAAIADDAKQKSARFAGIRPEPAPELLEAAKIPGAVRGNRLPTHQAATSTPDSTDPFDPSVFNQKFRDGGNLHGSNDRR